MIASHFGPFSFWSICLSPDHFGLNYGVGRFGPIRAGHFGPVSKMGCFGWILVVSRFGLIYLFGENR